MKRNPFLRVKLKSLAEEARIIRLEERRANQRRNFDLQANLREHRIMVVRREARATILAYNYLRGLPFSFCEQNKPSEMNPIDWESVKRMVRKYGRTDLDQETWMAGEVLKAA